MSNGEIINSKSATLVLQVNHLPIDCNLQRKKQWSESSHALPKIFFLLTIYNPLEAQQLQQP
jgi:hypothetical protein